LAGKRFGSNEETQMTFDFPLLGENQESGETLGKCVELREDYVEKKYDIRNKIKIK